MPHSWRPVASRLRDAGYVTGMVGKWHMGSQSARPGFDFSGIGVPAPVTVHTYHIGKGEPFHGTAHNPYEGSQAGGILLFHQAKQFCQRRNGTVIAFPALS